MRDEVGLARLYGKGSRDTGVDAHWFRWSHRSNARKHAAEIKDPALLSNLAVAYGNENTDYETCGGEYANPYSMALEALTNPEVKESFDKLLSGWPNSQP